MASTDVARPLWEPEIGWSPPRVEAFSLYRDLGLSRSLSKVSEKLEKDPSLIGKWSMQDKWVQRVAAYDAELDRVRRDARADEIEKVSRKHARALEASISVLAAPALELARRMEEEETKIDASTSVYELAAATDRAAKVLPSLIQASRLVHGLTTEKVDSSVTFRKKIDGADLADLDRMLTGLPDDGAEIVDAEVVDD